MYTVPTKQCIHCLVSTKIEIGTLHIKGTGTGTVMDNIKRTRTGTDSAKKGTLPNTDDKLFYNIIINRTIIKIMWIKL